MLLLLLGCSENNLVDQTKPSAEETAGAEPDIVVEPSAIDFGTATVGEPKAATLRISNVGSRDLFIDDLALLVENTEVTWTNLGSPVVAAGSATETVLTWLPWTAGGLSDTLRVTSDDPDEGAVDVPLSGGLPAGEILVEPVSHDFGVIDVGASAFVTVTVSNVGAGPLTIADATYTATDADLHVLDYGALATPGAVLDPGDATEVLVEYAPSDDGADEGTLHVYSDDPDTPEASSQHYGSGAELDPCDGFTKHVTLMFTVDDAWRAWIDGTEFTAPGANTWSMADTLEWDMACGDHVLAVYGTDTAQAISGLIAVVWIDGVVRFLSGPDNWFMTDAPPPAGWTDVGFDDSGWKVPEVCTDTSPWGTWPQPFYDQGAQWIWWTAQCHDLGEAWFRLDFSFP